MKLYQRVKELGEANKQFLLKYQWEWFCTLNLPSYADCPTAEHKLKEWRIRGGVEDRILVAYMGVFNTIPQPHIHLLMLSKPNKFNQTLLDINHKNWEIIWSDLTKSQAVIEPIYECEGVAHYIANKNQPWDRSELIQPYNERVLKKSMLKTVVDGQSPLQ